MRCSVFRACTPECAASIPTDASRPPSADGRLTLTILIATVQTTRQHRSSSMSDTKFASQADLDEKTISFDKLTDHAYAYTPSGDPNTPIIVGDDAVMVGETQATPAMA